MDMNDSSTSSSSVFSSSIQDQSISSAPIPVVTKTKSNKRQIMLVVDGGYHFQLKNVNSKKTIKFWRCARRSCGVIMHTTLNDEFIRYSGTTLSHDHLPNPAESELRELRERMRIRAEKDLISLQEIAEDEVRKALLTNEALAILPAVSTLGLFSLVFIFHNLTLFVFYFYLSNRAQPSSESPQNSAGTSSLFAFHSSGIVHSRLSRQ